MDNIKLGSNLKSALYPSLQYYFAKVSNKIFKEGHFGDSIHASLMNLHNPLLRSCHNFLQTLRNYLRGFNG